jgi:antitoxin PrlF
MEVSARLTTKGQVTIPRSVRQALSLEDGDSVIFRVDGQRAVMGKAPDLLSLAASISVPASKRGVPWNAIRRQTRRARASGSLRTTASGRDSVR